MVTQSVVEYLRRPWPDSRQEYQFMSKNETQSQIHVQNKLQRSARLRTWWVEFDVIANTSSVVADPGKHIQDEELQ